MPSFPDSRSRAAVVPPQTRWLVPVSPRVGRTAGTAGGFGPGPRGLCRASAASGQPPLTAWPGEAALSGRGRGSPLGESEVWKASSSPASCALRPAVLSRAQLRAPWASAGPGRTWAPLPRDCGEGALLGGFVGRRAGAGEDPRAATIGIRLPEVWRTGRPLVDPRAPAPPPGGRGDSGSGESQCFWVTKAAEGAPLSSEALQCGAPGEPGLPGATAPNPTPTRVQPHAARKWPTGRSTASWPDGTRGCGVGELDPFLYWLIFCYLRWAEGWGGGRGRAGWYCWCNGAFKRSGFADSCGPCTVPCRGGPGQGRE